MEQKERNRAKILVWRKLDGVTRQVFLDLNKVVGIEKLGDESFFRAYVGDGVWFISVESYHEMLSLWLAL